MSPFYRISEQNGRHVGHIIIEDNGQGYLHLVSGYTREPAKPLYVTEVLPPEEEVAND